MASGAPSGAASGPSLDEFGRIARFFAPLARTAPGALGLTDDAALMACPAGQQIVVTTDALVAGGHFLPDDPPDMVARKALRVNLSDLAAMGAQPFGYTLVTALTRELRGEAGEAWLARFAAGLKLDQEEFNITLLGGDSIATPGPLLISVTAFGHVPEGKAVTRGGARAGDLLFLSGTLGDGALGLRVLQGTLKGLSRPHAEALADRYRLPRPRVALGPKLVGLASAMMDVSDGLVGDLRHIAEVSGVGAQIKVQNLPLSPAGFAAIEHDKRIVELMLTGGDDYELLFTIAPSRRAEAVAAAEAAGVPITEIGRITAGGGVQVLDLAGEPMTLTESGYLHF
ncbi:MAG: thiamine-phosphate kinase [Alphaproteobacteria bacterium]|nr:thiamine-phosphate kinase [Alphaproteobacteria bacterium]MBU0798368.1 thiamine-phosphate kinase [Alphaproteobacteria bacterium]MBU0887817.1 thiamine-phosphate kinase [Alphaproteobacteria bacterium]MBU1814960.1 thiamine-phosphate kinase [Alphaproteobacteria bacterium]MBU2091387.1 thiamine-phosphate kinase [Alphaproteobacteria bacterium]